MLHDVFAVPFEEIAPILDRTPGAARQLASRARRRVQSTPENATAAADHARRREIIDAFLTAARGGDFDALLAVLDPDVVMRADRASPWLGGTAELRGRDAVHRAFLGRAQGSRTALVDGTVGSVWMPKGLLRGALRFTITGGAIRAIEVTTDPAHLARLDIVVLDAEPDP